jgi:hypothetical protein
MVRVNRTTEGDAMALRGDGTTKQEVYLDIVTIIQYSINHPEM